MESMRISRSLYGRLLAAYPQDFRARFGGEMVTVFGDQLADVLAFLGSFGCGWGRFGKWSALLFRCVWRTRLCVHSRSQYRVQRLCF